MRPDMMAGPIDRKCIRSNSSATGTGVDGWATTDRAAIPRTSVAPILSERGSVIIEPLRIADYGFIVRQDITGRHYARTVARRDRTVGWVSYRRRRGKSW